MKASHYVVMVLAGFALIIVTWAIVGKRPTCRQFVEGYEKNPAYMGQTAEQHKHYAECKAVMQ